MLEEIPKQEFDKSKINAWTVILHDIWGDDIEKIKSKLLLVANDKFIWTDEIPAYIDYEVSKLLN